MNYLYDLNQIEDNHERFASQNEVVAAQGVLRHLDKNKQLSKA